MSSLAEPGRSARETLDEALEWARTQPARELLLAWAPGLSLAWLSLALYYVERVEGVRALRPFFALAFSALFGVRAWVLSRWAVRRAEAALSPWGLRPSQARPLLAVRASLWVALDLWLWLWPMGFVMHLDPWLVTLVLPLLCLRGAVAPGWLCVVGASSAQSGLSALQEAIRHGETQRAKGVVCELFMLLGALALTFNLGALAALAVALGQSALGLDLAFVRAFLSPQNHFALLTVAALAFSLLEPVRAALSAVLYTEVELVQSGGAARALVERAVAPRTRMGRAAFALALGLSVTGSARAQPLACDERCEAARERDEAMRTRIEELLRAPEFAEFPAPDWQLSPEQSSVESWLERLVRWLLDTGKAEEQAARPALPNLELPSVGFFLGAAVVLVLLGVLWLGLSRRTLRPRTRRKSSPAPEADEPARQLEEARQRYAVDPRGALRGLYRGTLSGLARRRLLQLAGDRTNGQYLRQLAAREEQPAFAQLTQTFDAVQYGGHALTQNDFERCYALAQKLVQEQGS